MWPRAPVAIEIELVGSFQMAATQRRAAFIAQSDILESPREGTGDFRVMLVLRVQPGEPFLRGGGRSGARQDQSFDVAQPAERTLRGVRLTRAQRWIVQQRHERRGAFPCDVECKESLAVTQRRAGQHGVRFIQDAVIFFHDE